MLIWMGLDSFVTGVGGEGYFYDQVLNLHIYIICICNLKLRIQYNEFKFGNRKNAWVEYLKEEIEKRWRLDSILFFCSFDFEPIVPMLIFYVA